MKNLKSLSYFMMLLLVFGSFAPFATAAFSDPMNQGFAAINYGSITNTYQSSRPNFDSFYRGSMDTYWPILTRLEKDQCDATTSDFIITIPPMGCSPAVVRSDLLAEQNVPVFCQLSAIRVNPLIDVSTIKSISFKGDYPDEVAGISFHPARAAVSSYRTLIGSPIEENIGYVVIVLKRQPDERNLEEYISGMLTATVRYDAQGAFGTGSGEYYLEPTSDDDWTGQADAFSFWGGKGYLRTTNVEDNEATIEVMIDKDSVYRTVTLKEGETSSSIYYPGYYCTASLKLRLNKIDNSADMAKIDVDGDSYWVRKGSKFLDGKCTVRSLNVFPNRGGDVEISCSGSSKFRLVLTDKGVVLKSGDDEVNVMIGGSIEKDKNKYYLGYYGKNEVLEEAENNPNKDFVVLFEDMLSEKDVSQITGIYENTKFKDEDALEKALNGISKFDDKYKVLFLGGKEEYGIKFVSTDAGLSDGKYEGLIPDYIKKSGEVVEQLIKNFPAEKKENGEYWGEDALFKQIALAGDIEDEVIQLELIESFLDKYPGSKNVDYLRDLKLKLGMYNYEGSSKNIFVNNDNYNIRVDGFVSGGEESESVDIRMGGGSIYNLKKGKIYDGNNLNSEITDSKEQKEKVPRLTVVDIDSKGARFSYVWEDEKDKKTSKNFRVDVGSYVNAGEEVIHVVDTQVREVAHVSLIPEVRNTKTEANFTYNIGVEKRVIELSPEMAEKKVRALNKSIADWENRIEKLGELVKGLKGACFAVSTVLMFKSMFTGFLNAEAMARGDVMDFYEKKCREDHPGMDLQECYNTKFKTDIESAIDEYGAAVVRVNEMVKCAETDKTVDSEIWGSEVINQKAYVNKLKTCVTPKWDGWNVKIGNVELMEDNLHDAKDIQAVLLYKELCVSESDDSDSCQMAREEMKKQLYNNVEIREVDKLEKESKEGLGVALSFTNLNKDAQKVYYKIASQDIVIDSKIKIGKDSKYSEVIYNGENYVVTLDKNNIPEEIYKYENGKLIQVIETDKKTIKEGIQGSATFISSGKTTSCSNTMATPYVKYHEKYNKQSFAAIVPFDKVNGWYAYVEENDYSESGIANSFWICNVGTDRIIDDGINSGKDKCQLFQTSSAGNVADFIPCPSTSSSDVKKLYAKAEAKIREANRNGNGVSLDGGFAYKTTPYADVSTGMDCTDFMSLDDCSLMFNLCDPVICPPSRCNFGGKIPVSDVIASGVIGSLVLCLPNFGDPSKGKVVVPICLSGVHAGLDAYVSILRSYKDCLEKNIETGEYIGICDEITSIYMCEFFWGQLSPILDTILIRFVEALYGGFQVRGGAEYLTVQKAFENLDNSINYFTSTYAKGAFRAFTLKNTEEIGSMVCKGFIGSSVPTSADLIDSLLEPESPTQFHAYFSENIFSEATVPSTSHYKVYYHIYAGNDVGTQYQVYLKSPPASGYYASRPTLLVDSGYVDKGASSTEAIDFTAPSGYKELCVNINGQDECGFGSVSSSFALDYVSQEYIADQVDDRQITKTKDCVTTSASAWGMANPNIQAGIEKSLGGADIATSGIVRVCASTNPEQGVISGNVVYCDMEGNLPEGGVTESNPKCGVGYVCKPIGSKEGGGEGAEKSEAKTTGSGICESISSSEQQVSMGKWVDVGYCDEPSVRCWLDSTSIKDNLDVYMVMNNITSVNELMRDSQRLIELEGKYKTVREKLAGQRQAIRELEFGEIDLTKEEDIDTHVWEIIEYLNEIIGLDEKHTGQGTNADKAEALVLKANVYMTIVKVLIRENPEVEIVGGRGEEEKQEESEIKDIAKSKADVECEKFCDKDNKDFKSGKSMTEKEAEEGLSEGFSFEYDNSAYFEEEECFCYNDINDEGENVEDVESMKDCQIDNAEEIIKIAQTLKKNTEMFRDATIYKDTEAKNFECLVLQLAMQESSLSHCGTINSKGEVTECLECDKDFSNLIKGDVEEDYSYGIMQLNTKWFKNQNTFNSNVITGISKLIGGYNEEGRMHNDIEYFGWKRALRGYNGWGGGGDDDYVIHVLNQQKVIEDMFPECKIEKEYKVNLEESGFLVNKKVPSSLPITTNDGISFRVVHNCESVEVTINRVEKLNLIFWEVDNLKFDTVINKERADNEGIINLDGLDEGNYYVDKIVCIKNDGSEISYEKSNIDKEISVEQRAIEIAKGSTAR